MNRESVSSAAENAETLSAGEAAALLRSLPGVSGLSPERDAGHYRERFADEYRRIGIAAYGRSMGYVTQATRPEPDAGRLKLLDDDALVSFGFGRDGKAATAVLPMGEKAPDAVLRAAERLQRAGGQLFVKKVYGPDLEKYLERGFTHADFSDDYAPADLPDDVYPEVITDLALYATRSNVYSKFRGVLGGDSGVDLRIWDRETIKRHVSPLASLIRATPHAEAHMCFLRHLDAMEDPRAAVVFAGPFRRNDGSDIIGCTLAERIPGNAYAALMHLNMRTIPGLSAYMADRLMTGELSARMDVDRFNWGGAEARGVYEYKKNYEPHEEVRAHCLKFDPRA